MPLRLSCFILVCSILFANSLHALEPVFLNRLGGAQSDVGSATTVDANGNVYVAGHFSLTVDFDPGVGVTNLTADGSVVIDGPDVFIAKYSANGQLIWAKSLSGPGNDSPPRAIVVDPNDFSVYIAVTINDTLDVDPGASVVNVTATNDSMVLKLDSNGNFVWVKVLESTSGSNYAEDLVQDADGKLYVSGTFIDTTDFDPDAGTQPRTSSAPGVENAFILKLSSAGAYEWVSTITARQLPSLDVRNGLIAAAGIFDSNVDFDPGAGSFIIPATQFTACVWVVSTNGNFVDAKAFTGGKTYGFDCAFDTDGAILLSGSFEGGFDADPGVGTFPLSPTGTSSTFLIKLNSARNFVWARALNAANNCLIESLAVDSANCVYVFGAGSGNTDFLSQGLSNGTGFFVKYTSDGTQLFNAVFTNSSAAYSAAITVGATGRIVMTGDFFGSGDFDPNAGTATLTSAGASDAYLCSYRQLPLIDLNGAATGQNFSASFNQHGPVAAMGSTGMVSHEALGLITTLASASVVLTNAQNGANEVLAADAGATGIAVNYNPSSHTLTLSGTASQSAYQQVLRTITYNNTASISDLVVGTRSINFSLNDGAGTSAVATSQISVAKDAPPVASAGASPTAIPAGGSTQLTVTANDPEGDALTYSWNFGDGTPASSEQNPAHTYAAVGDYTATVIVTDSIGASTTATVTVHVGRSPSVRFTTSDVVGFVGQPLAFDATFSSDPENAIVSYTWNFGDGSALGSGQEISRVYATAGTYTVTLTILDADGLRSELSRQIEILPADQIGIFNSFIDYKVKWDRNKTNADTLTLSANVNVGDAIVGTDTPVAIVVAGKRYEGVLDGKLRDKNNSNKEVWQVTANTKKQSAGEVRIKFSAKKTSIGLEFNQAGAVGGGEDREVSVAIPVRIEIANHSFEVLIDSDFKFSKDGKKASGDGSGP